MKYKNDAGKSPSEDGILHQAKLKMDSEGGFADENKRKNSKRVVIGITTCLFLSAIGYITLKEFQKDEPIPQSPLKALRILSVDEDEIAENFVASSDEEVHALILRNQEQSERIKVLQGDINLLTQRLQELKTNFFATDIEGQQEQIAELANDLANKEELLNWFLVNLTVMDEELVKTRKAYKELQQDVLTQFSLDLETQLELVKEYNPVQGKKLRFIKDVLNQATKELDQQRFYIFNREFILDKMLGNPKNLVFSPFEKQWRTKAQDGLKNVSNLISALHYHLEINPTLDADAKIELYNLHDHQLADKMGMLNAGVIDLKQQYDKVNMLLETRKEVNIRNQSIENRYAFAHRKHLNNRLYLTSLELENSLLTAKVMIAALKKLTEGLPQKEEWTKQLTRNINILNVYTDNLKLELAKEELLKEKAKTAEIKEKFSQKKRFDNHLVLISHSLDDLLDNSQKILGKMHNILVVEYNKNNFNSIGHLASLHTQSSIPLVYEGYEVRQAGVAKGPARNSLSVENKKYKEEVQNLKKELTLAKKELKSMHKKMVDAQQEVILSAITASKPHTVQAIEEEVRKDLEMQLINSESTIRRLQHEIEEVRLSLKEEQQQTDEALNNQRKEAAPAPEAIAKAAPTPAPVHHSIPVIIPISELPRPIARHIAQNARNNPKYKKSGSGKNPRFIVKRMQPMPSPSNDTPIAYMPQAPAQAVNTNATAQQQQTTSKAQKPENRTEVINQWVEYK